MYQLEWDLTSLISNEKAFNETEEMLKKEIEALKGSNKKIDNAKKLSQLNTKKWDLKEQANKLLVYANLKYYKDISNEECIKQKKQAEKLVTELDVALQFIDNELLAMGEEQLAKFLIEEPSLQSYQHYFDNLFRSQKHIQNYDLTEKVKEYQTQINEQLLKYTNLNSTMSFSPIYVDEKEVTLDLTNYPKYLSAHNKKTRKDTYESLNKAYLDKAEAFATILDTIYQYRLNSTHIESYQSVLEKVLFEENIDPLVVETLIEVVNRNLFLLHDYLSLKTSFLKIEEPHLYDFGVGITDTMKRKYTVSEAISIIKEALSPLGEEYIKTVEKLLEGHLDLEPSKTKHPSIIFSWHTYSFMNFKGSYFDLKNLAHELGHIVNYYFSMQKQPFLYEDSTVFTSEVASLVNEILLNQYLAKKAESKEEKLFYLSKEIENYVTTVFKQTMYTEFENQLYKEKETVALTASKISGIFQQIIMKYYGNNITYDDYAKVEWMRLGHLYRHAYYPYKYAMGLMIASVVVTKLRNNSLSKEVYQSFLEAGSSQYSHVLLQKIGIDLTDLTIMEEAFKIVQADLEEFSHLTGEIET